MQVPTIQKKSNSKKIAISNILEHQRSTRLAWRQSTARDRIQRLNKLEDWVNANQDDIRLALADDFKKPEMETDTTEIFPVLSEIRHARRHLKSWMRNQRVNTPLTLLGTSSWVQYEPKGSCLIIAPWNYPFNLLLTPLISCLAAGCTAVLKPSEMTPRTAGLLERLVEEVFVTQEVALYTGGKETSQELLSQPFDHIFFTGSPQVGKIIMEAAAKNLSSVTLELGGKSPAIITESANLKSSAERLAVGKWINAGQTCIAPDYVLVHESVANDFCEALTDTLIAMYGSSKAEQKASPHFARVINNGHFTRLNNALAEALGQGAQVVCGGYTDSADNFVGPTVIKDLEEGTTLLEEEIFGPILPIKTYTTLAEAIAYVNSKPKPLALYLFSTKNKDSQKVLSQTSSGGVCLNDSTIHFLNANLPFGGVNNSGIGKAHGEWGFKAFSNAKAVLKQRQGLTSTSFFKPPYSAFAKTAARLILKFL